MGHCVSMEKRNCFHRRCVAHRFCLSFYFPEGCLQVHVSHDVPSFAVDVAICFVKKVGDGEGNNRNRVPFQVQEDEHVHADWRRLQRASRINEEPEAIDPKFIGRHAFGEQNSRGQWLRHWAAPHQLILAHTFFKKQDYNKATYHLTKHCKQFDCVLVNTALFRHCEDAVTTGQIDMHGDHTAVIARIEQPLNHKSPQSLRPAKKAKKKKQSRFGDNKLNWNEHTIHTYQAHPMTSSKMP